MSGFQRLDPRQMVPYEMAIEAAFPGVKCNRVECSCFDDGDVMWRVSVSAPEHLLAEFRLVDPALLATLPQSGVGRRGGLSINRGKSRTRLEGLWYSALDDDDDTKEPERNLEARILSAISPWRPKTAA